MTRRSVFFRRPRRSHTPAATWPLLVVVSMFHLQNASAQERYEDGEFQVDASGTLLDWSPYGSFNNPPDAPGGGFDASAPRSGGNPQAYVRPQLTSVTVPLGGMWSVWGFLINDQAVYDPASLGAIERIDFDFDSRIPPGGRGSRAVSLGPSRRRWRRRKKCRTVARRCSL